MTDRRTTLKSITAAAHRALDEALGKIETKQDYARYLWSLASFRGSIEPKVIGGFSDSLYQPTRLQDTLLKDCADVGVDALDVSFVYFPDEKESGFGMAYVLEGSTLGAPFLSRSAQQLGFGAEFGARHLARQVAARSNWSLFVEALEQEPVLDMEKTSAAAVATFNLALVAAQKAVNAPKR